MKKHYESPILEELCSEDVMTEVLYDSTKDNTSGDNWEGGDTESDWNF